MDPEDMCLKEHRNSPLLSLAMKGAFPSSILSCLVGWPQAHTTESTNHGPVPLKLGAAANSNKQSKTHSSQTQMSKNLFRGQIPVTRVQEHGFGLPWILCFNVVTLSWRVPSKRNERKVYKESFTSRHLLETAVEPSDRQDSRAGRSHYRLRFSLMLCLALGGAT